MYKCKLVILLAVMITVMGCDSESPTANGDEEPTLDRLKSSTGVPGHQDRYDKDNNGYPDEGVIVNGKYKALRAYDAHGDYYFNHGDGRIEGTVGSVKELDQSTLSVCDYEIQYRGAFDNDPYLDSGWIINNINCSGYAGKSNSNYLAVHETDPRYTGDPDLSVWGSWEYHVRAEGGIGNLARPENDAGK